MNKKFFTLIASVLMLVGFVGSGYAQGISIPTPTVPEKLQDGHKYQIAIATKGALEDYLGGSNTYEDWTKTNKTAADATAVLNALSGTTAGFPASGPGIVVDWSASNLLFYGWIDVNGNLNGEPANANLFTGKYYESIFCVNISRPSSAGQRATLDIINMANGYSLQVDPSVAVSPWTATPTASINAAAGYLGDWGYSSTYENRVQHWRPLYTYKEGDNDNVYIFVADVANYLDGTTTHPVKLTLISADDLYTNNLPLDALLFEFVEPAPVILSAADFNSKLGIDLKAKAQKLTFTGDAKTKTFVPNNGYGPWRDVALTAYDVTPISLGLFPLPDGASTPYGGAAISGSATDKWLYFQASAGDNKDNFLYVDTGYYGTSNSNLKFAWGDTLSAYTRRTFYTESEGYDRLGIDIPATKAEERGLIDTTGFKAGTPSFASDFINHYRFQVTYFWTEDSLAIDVAEANFKDYRDPRKFFEVEPLYWDAPYYEYTGAGAYADNQEANDEYIKDYNTAPLGRPSTATDGDYLHVKLLDLESAKVLTIGDRTINTNIKFNMPDCKVADNNRVSIPEGVYIIRNAGKNLLLHVPIYSDTTALWVTPKANVEPMNMPSYQWVVKKTSSANPDHSPITIYNREFPNVTYRGLVLLADDFTMISGEQVDKTYSTKADWNHKDRSFQHVNPEQLTKKHLGYYHIDEATAKISKFDLNYYNQFLETQTHFINKNNAVGDSSLAVNTARDMQFTFIPQDNGKARYYGYVPTRVEVTGLGIDTLWRVAYQLKTKVYENGKAVEKILVINKEHRYVLSNIPEYRTASWSNAKTDSSIFLFKTNNTTLNIDQNVVDFYALLDTTSHSAFLPGNFDRTGGVINDLVLGNTGVNDGTSGTKGGLYDLRYVKLGVPEDTKWIYEQVQDEQRTSAFAVTSYTPPLYRRFDNNKYKAYQNETLEVTEPFGDKNDSPLYLKFTRQNNFGFEFLSENSAKGLGNNNEGGVGATFDPSKPATTVNDYRQALSAYGQANTSFLGYYNKGQYPEQANKLSYTFYVDTVYTRRPAIGSNTTAFTPKPQYMLALRAQYYPKDKLYYDGEGQWYYSDGTPVPGTGSSEHLEIEIPAFTVGDYLYNAQDSVNRGREDFRGKVESGTQGTTRLAFVRGFHMMRSDSFFVIPNGTVNGINYAALTDLEILRGYNYYLREKLPVENQHYLGVNTHYEERYTTLGAAKASNNNAKAMVFQFRLIPDQLGDRRFIIETQLKPGETQYGPDFAKWLRWENGVPVLTDELSFYDAFTLAHNGADVFNVEAGDGEIPASQDKATANEAATVEGAKVISGTGSVTILNAAGKTVTVTNVLGQVVAKQVATSDNATIALPKGIVVVSVDGNSSKALVK
ncbi:hypothetical protein FACS189438_1520 [Bacteroidia bacterium]|nr:hypothetical protein FACS189438_1520 [Bacteroidia bacterium]